MIGPYPKSGDEPLVLEAVGTGLPVARFSLNAYAGAMPSCSISARGLALPLSASRY